MATAALKETALLALHKAHKARLAPFAGYNMPIQYPAMGVLKEHHHTRQAAGLFDVSHMGQVRFHGADREKFLEWVTPADIAALKPGQGRLSMLTNAAGGIIDDCIVTRYEKHLFLVINAGCKDKDLVHLDARLKEFGGDVQMEIVDRALVALQGPKAAAALGRHIAGLEKLPFMSGVDAGMRVAGIDVQVTRCGYTGEDGFEIAVANDKAEALAQTLLADPSVALIGLGARDSLRLEAGMCLYGHELDEATNPVAARLMWCITKRRLEEAGAGFIGRDAIRRFRDAQKELVPRVRVGIVSAGTVARDGAAIKLDGKEIGKVTSGCPSPTLGKNVAMGYVDRAVASKGQRLQLDVRGRLVDGEIVTLPFVPNNYYKSA